MRCVTDFVYKDVYRVRVYVTGSRNKRPIICMCNLHRMLAIGCLFEIRIMIFSEEKKSEKIFSVFS